MFSTELIAHFKRRSTPFYYYDLDRLKTNLEGLTEQANAYKFKVHYALKANSNVKLLTLIKSYGLGADCVSGNEIKRALEAGFDAQEIAFAGVGKTDEEILLGLEHDIFSFNCESVEELKVIDALARQQDKTARIALRINPDVNASTHHYITTGLEENKFGINFWELEEVFALLTALKNVELVGLHFHIGSQITDLSAFRKLCIRANEIQEWFWDRQVIVEHINVGGGLGINYHMPDEEDVDFGNYFKIFHELLKLRPRQQLHFELGRSVVGHCGSLISRVLYIKNGINKHFVILDAGMTELIRPALYQSFHTIQNITSREEKVEQYDVVGPICESSDCFGKRIELPITQRGDLVAIRSTGAYGEVMASDYNLRSRARAYYSDEIKVAT